MGLNDTTSSAAFVAEFEMGSTNVAITVFVVGREMFAPLMLPREYCEWDLGALAGGFIGVVGNVIIMITGLASAGCAAARRYNTCPKYASRPGCQSSRCRSGLPDKTVCPAK